MSPANAQDSKVKRSRRPSAAQLRAAELRDASFDHERLGKQTYLTVPELCAYGRFKTEHSAYQFLTRHQIPKCRKGRSLIVLRRDFDRAVQPPCAKVVRSKGNGRPALEC
jgi:hypothetical protein